MTDSEKIAKAIHELDMDLQSRGEDKLTSVQRQGMIVAMTVAVRGNSMDPEDCKNNILSNYQGSIFDAARCNYSKGTRRIA